MESVILVEPEVPENTGFIARLADNYSTELRIVNPQFQLDKARKTATNAQEKLRNARIYDEAEEAVKDLEQVVGTKPGKGLSSREFQPRENTSLMIGRESSGLTNQELDLCDATVHIETPGYRSLNQSHATAILLHQLTTEQESESLSNQQKKALKQKTGGGKLHELLLRSSPTREEYQELMGQLNDITEK